MMVRDHAYIHIIERERERERDSILHDSTVMHWD